MLELSVLGPLRVIADDRELALGSLQQRALLARLLIHSGEPVSRDRLVDELWGERPPPSAGHAVQVYVSGIRKSLRGCDVELRSTGSGYVLEVDRDLVDACRFEQLVDEAHRRLADDPSGARGLFERALALWRGPPLGEFADFEFARDEAARLQELHTVALVGLVETRLAAGEHAEVIGQLTGLAAANPLRERPRRLLMLALYRSGRHAEALAAYGDAVAALDEIGLQPGPELRALQEAILRHDPSLRTTLAGQVDAVDAPGVPVDDDRGGALKRPVPDVLRWPRDSPFEFVGRRGEIEQLVDGAQAVRAGSGRTALLSGEPGVGKTSLCRAVVQEVHEEGMCVLYGRCDEDFLTAYQPFAEALTHLVVHADEALLREHVGTNGGVLLTLVPSLGERIPEAHGTRSADPDSERFRLFSAVVSLLASASSNSGLLLVVDDLHWADKASLQLLSYLASSTELSRVMILGTYRDSELPAGSALSDTLASLRRVPGVDRIDLVGLEAAEIVEMMEHAAGHALDPDGVELAHAVRRETEGNPFFTIELLRHLAESGLVHQDGAGRWVASDDLSRSGLPRSVREVVGQRVDRLGERTRRILSHAAVIGRDFDILVLAAVTDVDEDALLDVMEDSVRAGLISEVEGVVDRFSFCHALTQHTLYADLGNSRRARIHREVAEVLERFYGDAAVDRAAELARHFAAATKVDTLKAITYSKRAGEQALLQFAPGDAMGWFLQALDLYTRVDPDPGLRCDLLVGLGTAQRCSGERAHRQTLLDAAAIARELGDTPRLVAAALANSRGGVSSAGVIDQERIDVLEAALDALPTSDSRERALLLATESAELSYVDQPDRLSEISSNAIGIARRLGDATTLLRVMSLIYHGYVLPDNLEQRLEDLRDALEIASMNADPAVALQLHNSRAIACLQAGDRDGFDLHAEQCWRLAERLGQPFERWTALALRCNQALIDADATAAETHANAAAAAAGDGVPEALPTFGTQLIEIRRLQGRLGELADLLHVIATVVAENPGLPVLQIVLARLYCDLERSEEVDATNAKQIAVGSKHFPYDYAWLPGLCLLSTVCVDLEFIDGAERLLECLHPWREQVASAGVTCQGPVALYLGSLALLLGDLAAAEVHFRQAIQLAERLRGPYWKVRALLGLATTIERRERDASAGAALREDARNEAARHGLEHLLESLAPSHPVRGRPEAQQDSSLNRTAS